MPKQASPGAHVGQVYLQEVASLLPVEADGFRVHGHGETLDQSFVWKRLRVVTAIGVRNSKVFLFFSRLLSFSEMVDCRHIYNHM